MSNLSNAVKAAQTYYTDENGVYTGMDAADLRAIESSFLWDDGGTPAVANTVYVSGVGVTGYE